jgi:hypothetical protein
MALRFVLLQVKMVIGDLDLLIDDHWLCMA